MQRMKAGNARVVLRKHFLYRKDSPPTIMQEIWINDESNPDAQGPTGDPYKEFSVVHVHRHAAIASKGGVRDVDETKHLDVVNGINVRHLAHIGHSYQKGNPFFNTYIEPSDGTSLKVYPTDWTCGACRLSNFPKSRAGVETAMEPGRTLPGAGSGKSTNRSKSAWLKSWDRRIKHGSRAISGNRGQGSPCIE